MFCEKCGNQMSADALFCSKCGAKVVAVEKETVIEEKPVYNVKTPVVEMPVLNVQPPVIEMPVLNVQPPVVEKPVENIQKPAIEMPALNIQAPAVEKPALNIQAPAVEKPVLNIQTPVVEKPVEKVQMPVVGVSNNIESLVHTQGKAESSKSNNKKNGLIIGVVVGLVAIVIAVVAIIFFAGSNDYSGEYYGEESQVIYDENGQPISDEQGANSPDSNEQSVNSPNQEYYYVPGESTEPQSIVLVTGEASFYDDNKDWIEEREITIEVPTVGIASQRDMDGYWVLNYIKVRQYEGRSYVEIGFVPEDIYMSSARLTLRLAYDSYNVSIENMVIGVVEDNYNSIIFMPNGKAIMTKFGSTETLMSGYYQTDANYLNCYGNFITYEEYQAESQRIEDWVISVYGYNPIIVAHEVFYDYYF